MNDTGRIKQLDSEAKKKGKKEGRIKLKNN
jgi:hypothetical protein